MAKTYPNTKKGRKEIKKKPAVYNLKNRKGTTTYTGMTKDANRRVKEHHSDSSKNFSKVSVTYTKSRKKANEAENKRLKSKKPRDNKKKK
jgi:predicted GIY-YIG superfamily endonuclease